MLKGIGLLVFGLAVLLSSGQSQASYVIYTNRALFEAGIKAGTETTENFNEISSSSTTFYLGGVLGPNTNPVGLTTGITVTGSGGFLASTSSSVTTFYPSNGTYLYGSVGSSQSSGISVAAPSGLPTYDYSAVGADVGPLGANGTVSFYGTTSLGENFSGTVSVNGATSLGFLGIISTNPITDYITSINFTTYNVATSTTSSNDVALDNFSFGQAIPEPGSMALLAVGGLLLGVRAIRRRGRSLNV